MALVGPANAAEILFSARRYTAEEALRMGLINRVVPREQLHHDVLTLARTIRDNAPLTVALCKASIRELQRPDEDRDVDRLRTMVEACFRSEDDRGGQRAVAEKRPPVLRGR